MQRIELLDTTLRDGAQGEGVEHSLSDKRKIALALDRLGVPLIEGGNPTGNPKDQTFFEEARTAPFLTQAVLVPFGSTCHARAAPEEDAGLAALLGTEQPVVSLFGKADIRQVTEVLRVTPQENLRMIRESVAYLAGKGRRVLFDAEHFFDGAQYDRDYAMEALRAARQGGADVLVLAAAPQAEKLAAGLQRHGVFVLAKPLSSQQAAFALRLVRAARARAEKLEQENRRLLKKAGENFIYPFTLALCFTRPFYRSISNHTAGF